MTTNFHNHGFSRPSSLMNGFSQKPTLEQETKKPLIQYPEEYTFFWRGPLSQWNLRDFYVDNIKYNCGEQYMMAEKARLFNDHKILQEIMKYNKTPKEYKALGRDVSKFNQKKWDENDIHIVKRGNHAKFTQNEDYLKLLFKAEGTTLVEASPYDQIWGIGLGENDPRAKDRKQWRGKNKLGFILTDLMNELIITHKHLYDQFKEENQPAPKPF